MGEKAVLSRPTMGAKKLSWNDMTSSSPRIHVTRRILQLQNDKSASEILDRAKQFCSEYVNAKLEREGLKTFSITEKYSDRPSRVSKRIQEVGVLLEECYPRLYTDISRHINTTLTSESVVNDVFLSVSTEILSEGINWARLVALYAFAGALTVECYEKGKQAFVVDMGNWMYEFAALYMVDWIKRRGGWVSWYSSLQLLLNLSGLYKRIMGATCANSVSLRPQHVYCDNLKRTYLFEQRIA